MILAEHRKWNDQYALTAGMLLPRGGTTIGRLAGNFASVTSPRISDCIQSRVCSRRSWHHHDKSIVGASSRMLI